MTDNYAKIELELVLRDLEKNRPHLGEIYRSEEIGNNSLLELVDAKSNRTLIVFLIYERNSETLRRLETELNGGVTDILILGMFSFRGYGSLEGVLPAIGGTYPYAVNNIAFKFWDDQRIRSSTKETMYFLEKIAIGREFELTFTRTIHPDQLSLSLENQENLNYQIQKNTGNKKVRIFGVRIFLKYNKLVLPIWVRIPFRVRKIIKRVITHE